MSTATPESPSTEQLAAQLAYLKLLFIQEHYAALSQEAVQAHWGYVDYLARLIAGETLLHRERESPAAHSPGTLPRHQDPGAVSVELAT